MDKKNNKILVITKGAWRSDNNTGNTLNEIFSNWKGEVFNLACSAEMPDDNICSRHFALPEKDLIEKLKNKKYPLGYEITSQNTNSQLSKVSVEKENEFYNYYRTHKSHFKYLLRDVLWSVTDWKSVELVDFLRSINPDAIFMVGYGQSYLYSILNYVHELTNKPVYISFMDDYYTFKQFSLSPFFWIRRIYMRRIIKAAVSISSGVFAISPLQAIEYGKIFNRDFTILAKSYDFTKEPIKNIQVNSKKVVILYAGNIMCGRYITLGLISEAVHKLNEQGYFIEFEIYSRNPLTQKIKKELKLGKGVIFGGAISADEVEIKLRKSDIVIHSESFMLSERYDTRLSFSTKLVDYMRHQKCILAVGWKHSASMKLLSENNAACIVENINEVYDELKRLIDDRTAIENYGLQAWNCGEKHFNKVDMVKRIESIMSNE